MQCLQMTDAGGDFVKTETQSEATPIRREGPKRSEASRMAILSAAREELIENGWRNFSPDRLARRARASKQTIYRWWPSVAVIAVEAATTLIEDPIVKSEQPLDVQLAAFIDPIAELARVGDGAHLLRSALLAAADDAHAGEAFRAWFNESLRRPMKNVLAQASNRGMIRRDYDFDTVCEMLFGPIWHRLIVMRGPVPQVLAMKSAQAVFASLRP